MHLRSGCVTLLAPHATAKIHRTHPSLAGVG